MSLYNIQTVSQLSGVSAHCVRAWERRYGAMHPQRDFNGRRLYSEQDLERAILLGKLCQMGSSIGNIARLSDEELKAFYNKVVNRFEVQNTQEEISVSKSIISSSSYLSNLLMALGFYKLDVITHELNKASLDLTENELAFDIIIPLFTKIGEEVAHGRMSIAQEHAISAITKFFISKRIAQLSQQRRQKPRFKALLATPEGEHHEIGILLSALLLSAHGADVMYLGENLPESTIGEAAKALNPDILLLSVGRHFQRQAGRDINQVVAKIKNLMPQKTKFWIGGHLESLTMNSMRDYDLRTFNSLKEFSRVLSES